jgi:hypothetical protein
MQGCHSRIAGRLLGGFGVADGVDQVRFNQALRVNNGPLNIGAAPQLRVMPIWERGDLHQS